MSLEEGGEVILITSTHELKIKRCTWVNNKFCHETLDGTG